MDYTTLTDDEFAAAETAVLIERERRNSIANIPEQVRALQDKFIRLGGKPDKLPARPVSR